MVFLTTGERNKPNNLPEKTYDTQQTGRDNMFHFDISGSWINPVAGKISANVGLSAFWGRLS